MKTSWLTRIAHDVDWIGMRLQGMMMSTIQDQADLVLKWMVAEAGVQQPVAVDLVLMAAAGSPVLWSCWCQRSSCVKAIHPHAGAPARVYKDQKTMQAISISVLKRVG